MMIDTEIIDLLNSDRLEDWDKAIDKLALSKEIAIEETQMVIDLLILAIKTGDSALLAKTNRLFSTMKRLNPNLEHPKRLLDNTALLRGNNSTYKSKISNKTRIGNTPWITMPISILALLASLSSVFLIFTLQNRIQNKYMKKPQKIEGVAQEVKFFKTTTNNLLYNAINKSMTFTKTEFSRETGVFSVSFNIDIKAGGMPFFSMNQIGSTRFIFKFLDRNKRQLSYFKTFKPMCFTETIDLMLDYQKESFVEIKAVDNTLTRQVNLRDASFCCYVEAGFVGL